MATFMERLAFLPKVPTLMKATADDETPCPGYLFEEIGNFSRESVGCSQCLLEYLLERLQVDSCHVKLKVLKILLHLCSSASPHLVTELRRNITFVQEATVFSGPPDPIHGNVFYQRVRMAAQELASVLFADTVSPQPTLSPCKAAMPSLGMGSDSGLRSGVQGFGYSPGRHGSSGTLLDRIQKAAEVVVSAVLPPTEHNGIRLHENNYQPVVAPSAVVEVAVPACPCSVSVRGVRAQRCPGQPGGGWEESDSGHSSQNSSQEKGDPSRASQGSSSSKSGTDSQSGASRESGDLSERVEVMHLGDCAQEMILINRLTEGSKVFLSREETQHFLKECATLNCEAVVELLCGKLQGCTQTVQMRALCAVACLMSSDLLSLDHVFGVTQKHLVQLSNGPPGAVANKATKLLRQFEALMHGQQGASRCDGSDFPAVTGPAPLQDSSKLMDTLFLPTSRGETNIERAPGSQDVTLQGEISPPRYQNSISSVSDSEWDSRCTQTEVQRCGSELFQPTVNIAKDVLPGRDPEHYQDGHLGACASSDSGVSGQGTPAGDSVSEPASAVVEDLDDLPSNKLSLFSGMELVRGKPSCFPDSSRTEATPPALCIVQDTDAHRAAEPTACFTDNTITASPPSDSERSQHLSAFSFLNV
ncbi:AP-4 complex accessory subunit Tepsin isoform X1 [Lepisosteus oculatus]|uniref:AP-4 complex accessory subunit Tepsin isoform X1 n=2 Tax=Lepisosteus oculatus TaxID=7918 RepID=UPI0037235667